MTRPKLRGPGKPPVDLKHGRANERPIRIRVSDEQRLLLEGAARRRKLRVSTWLRDLGLRVASHGAKKTTGNNDDVDAGVPQSAGNGWPSGEPVVYAVNGVGT